MDYTDLPSAQEMAKVKSYAVKIVGAVLLGIIGLGLLLSIRSVDAGTVAVVQRFGKVTGRTLSPGLNIIMPFAESTVTYNTKKVIYETSTEDKQKGSKADYKDYPVDTNTEDGQRVDIFYTVRFNIDPTKATWVAQNIGNEGALVEKVVKTESRIWARNIPRRFTADSLYTGSGSQEVQNEIFNSLESTFRNNGLTLDSVGIREIKFSGEYIDAIENKQIQAVKVETEKNIAEQALYQKEARITQAEGMAREQDLQKLTLTSQLLQKLWIEAWEKGGSQVPQIITSDNAGMFLNIPR